MREKGKGMAATETAGDEKAREYRKGNWTLEETMLLIEAKKMDNERRAKRSSSGGGPAELKWKLIEDYCWRMGCRRSQNQCNDKWDNLMRDYKKVRKHEMIMAAAGEDDFSFWKLNAHERKEKGLPANFLLQVYEALNEVTERRDEGLGDPFPAPPKEISPPPAQRLPPPISLPQASHGLDPESTRNSYGSPRRKRVRGRGEMRMEGGLAAAISKGVAVVAEALMEGEEKEETRHRELLQVKERWLRVEHARAETAAEAMAGLVAEVEKLARSIRGAGSRQAVGRSTEQGKQ